MILVHSKKLGLLAGVISNKSAILTVSSVECAQSLCYSFTNPKRRQNSGELHCPVCISIWKILTWCISRNILLLSIIKSLQRSKQQEMDSASFFQMMVRHKIVVVKQSLKHLFMTFVT